MIGIVLAGGRSTRMKQDKATLPHPKKSQQTLLDYALEQLLRAGCEKVLISGDKFGGVADCFQNKGPLAGIYSVTQAFTDQSFLIIPVDMPLLDHALLRELLTHATQYPNVHFENAPFPMVIQLNQQIKQHMHEILSDDTRDRSLVAFLDYLQSKPVNCSTPEKLYNTNSPEDWNYVREHC
jgi:molybdopterin-guanine dinucleotide biosynthesis protein A